MSWNTFNVKYASPIIAEKSFKVIKLFAVIGKDYVMEPYSDIRYAIGENMPSIRLVLTNDSFEFDCDLNSYGFIRNGYKSYADANLTIRISNDKKFDMIFHRGFTENKQSFFMFYKPDLPILIPYECVIPEGTEYYVNENNEIISETIIVIKPHDFVLDDALYKKAMLIHDNIYQRCGNNIKIKKN